MKHDSTDITDDFKRQTEDRSKHVAPGLMFDSKKKLCDKIYPENRCVDGISRERRQVQKA